MKKIALGLVAALALAGCGSKNKPAPAANSGSLTSPPPAPAPMPVAVTPVTPVTADPLVPAFGDNGAAPAPGKSYRVVKGDTLWNIASRAYGGTKVAEKVTRIKAANPTIKGDTISVGQTITIP